MAQTTKTSSQEPSTSSQGTDGLLRTEKKTAFGMGGLLRRMESKGIISKTPKEGRGRHFAKAYAYRLYTSAWVTPLITIGTLAIKDHYHLRNGQAALIQGGMELVVKPFTYALFEWGAAHIRWGYRANGASSAAQSSEISKQHAQ